jgi:putative oxidoreductase
LLGQVILGGFFIVAGLNQVVDKDRLGKWTDSKGVPYASALVVISGLAVIVGGAAIIADPFVAQNTATIGVVILVAFLIVITPIMHNFWRMAESEGIYSVEATDGGEVYTLPPQPNELSKFLQNIGLIGALLALL